MELEDGGRLDPKMDPKDKKEETITFSSDIERDFFRPQIQKAAQDVVGRALTPKEFDMIAREVAERTRQEKSEVRKFLSRYGRRIAVALSLILGYQIAAKANEVPPTDPIAVMDTAHQEKIVAEAVETASEQSLGEDYLEFVGYNHGAYKNSPEHDGRTGKGEWTPYERLHYSKLPIEAKLYAMHPEFGEYSDAEYLTHFDEMMESARTEFRHTDLREQLAVGAIERLVRLAPVLQPQELLQHYDNIYPLLENEMGVQYTLTLRLDLLQVLSPDHLVALAIAQSHVSEDEQLLDKNVHTTGSGGKIQRSIHFDQDSGVVDVQAQVGDRIVLVSSFPGNGGDPRMEAFGKRTKEFAATRPGTFRIAQLERGHVSLSWANSLIPQDAAIKEVGGQIMYEGKDGKFHYATGPNAEFAGRTPFDGKLTAADRQLLESAGERRTVKKIDTETIQDILKNGGWVVKVGPTANEYILPLSPFTVSNFTDEHGQLVSHWTKNDFGPRSILYTTLDGQSSSQLFHSSYNEQQGVNFLDHSHGCVHMYQEDLGAVFELVNPGDLIHIEQNVLHFEDEVISTKKLGSEPREVTEG